MPESRIINPNTGSPYGQTMELVRDGGNRFTPGERIKMKSGVTCVVDRITDEGMVLEPEHLVPGMGKAPYAKGTLIPLKGCYFRVVAFTKHGIRLEFKEFTGSKKKRKRKRAGNEV